MLGIILLSLVGILVIIGILFVNLSPQFGGKPTEEEKAEFAKTNHYKDEKFQNLIPTEMSIPAKEYPKLIWQYFTGIPNGKPSGKIPVEKVDSSKIVENKKITRLTWFGHSAFLLEISGKKILIDPMLGEVAAPHPWLGSPRFNDQPPISIEQLPHIDAIIISHDHYDHLDYSSIQKLKGKTGQFFVPLGVGTHFREWGVADEKIHELDWWEEIDFEDLKLACLPARHFSGRGLTRDETLWASWAIFSEGENIYFSGDGGYGPHFKEIGEKYGPFDFAMLECGQYDARWEAIHMLPEQTVQAAIDVKAEVMMPIHWGAFALAMHTWTEPAERAAAEAERLGVQMVTPRFGEQVVLGDSIGGFGRWWDEVD